MLHRWILVASLLAALPAQADAPAQPEDTIVMGAGAAATAGQFMVTAAHSEAVAVGHAVLEAGGNAIDAMVAVQIMLNLVEPQSSGIGGGSFLLYWDAAEERLISIDGRSLTVIDTREAERAVNSIQ